MKPQLKDQTYNESFCIRCGRKVQFPNIFTGLCSDCTHEKMRIISEIDRLQTILKHFDKPNNT